MPYRRKNNILGFFLLSILFIIGIIVIRFNHIFSNNTPSASKTSSLTSNLPPSSILTKTPISQTPIQSNPSVTALSDETVTITPGSSGVNATPITPTLVPTQNGQIVPGVPVDIVLAIREKSLGYNLDVNSFSIWDATARPDDIAKVGPQGYEAGSNTDKGFLVLQYPPMNSIMPDPSAELIAKVGGIGSIETDTPDQIIAQAQEVHQMGKAFVVAPTGSRLEIWDPDTIQSIAKSSDIFIIQAERWLTDDTSSDKHTFIEKVMKYSLLIREANPSSKIFVEVGRRADRGGGTAEEWINAIALLYQKAPTSFDGIYLFITRQPTELDQGIGALMQMVAWLRQ